MPLTMGPLLVLLFAVGPLQAAMDILGSRNEDNKKTYVVASKTYKMHSQDEGLCAELATKIDSG